MRFKLDENLDTQLASILIEHSHDVATVLGQHLGGRPDEMIYRTCVAEKRLIVEDWRGSVLTFYTHRRRGHAVAEKEVSCDRPCANSSIVDSLARKMDAVSCPPAGNRDGVSAR
jgi:Domain of unknown function (DUF5615)